MLDAALEALAAFTEPTMLLFLGIGVLIGLIIGVIPGLGGTGAVAVLLPFVFVLEPNQAIAMIIGAVAVVHTSDVITSVVLGIPGSAAASVFLLDGHELAKKGQAGRVLSMSFIASMLGGLVGIVALTLLVPIAQPIVTAFGSPEIFALIIMGVFLTAMLSKGNIVKGLLISAFGLALGLIGVSPVSAEYRYTFGSEFLTDGVGLVAAALGIFGLSEIIDLVAKKGAISSGSVSISGGWRQGVKDVFTYKGDVLRGSAVGVGVGVLPGVGATAGSWLAYGQAQAFASRRRDSMFGKGDPRGVIAPSAASNGIESGALIPTLLFGVPGAAPFALLLGVLLIFFVVAIVFSSEFSENGRLFPFAVGLTGVLLAGISLLRDLARTKKEHGLGRLNDAWRARLVIVGKSILWILAYIWMIFIFGMIVGSGAYAVVFLLVVARMRWWTTLIYSACIVGALVLLVEWAQLVPPSGYLF